MIDWLTGIFPHTNRFRRGVSVVDADGAIEWEPLSDWTVRGSHEANDESTIDGSNGEGKATFVH